MGLSVGIVGLPNVGKSTIFNALTAAGAQSANYPFCTIEPNIGVVPVVDIAGLVRGASKAKADDERSALRESNLITMKPVLFVANVAEADLGKETDLVKKVRRIAAEKASEVVVICGELEAQIAQLPPEERREFLREMGLAEPGLDVLVRAAGPKEARTWTTHRGSKAPQAAGAVHSDFERGFIRAETIPYEDYVELGGEQAARAAGKMRSEGREYEVQDGDVILFRFNV